MASSQSLENKKEKLQFIIFFSNDKKKILKLIVLYSCFHSVRISDLEKIQESSIAEWVQLPTL